MKILCAARRPFIAGALVLAFALQAGSVVSAADPYEINVILPLTGIGAFLGKNEAAALGFVERNVNQSGGVRGRQIKFVVADDQSTPAVAVQLLNGLIAKKVPVVLGSTLVAMCSAMLPLIDNGPVDFCFSSGVHPPKGSYMYSGNLSTVDLMAILMRYFRERGWTKIALIVTTDASGQDGEKSADDALSKPENKSVTIVSREHFNASDLAVNARIARVKASGAQAVIAYAAGTPLGTVLHGISDAGLELPVGTTSANLSYEAMKQFNAILPKEFYFVAPPGVASDALPNGQLKNTVRTFVESAKAANLHADIGLIAGYDPGLIVVTALKKFGFGMTSAQLKDYVDHLSNFPGAYGIYDFRDGSQRGLAPSNGIIVKWDPARDYWVSVSKFGGAL